MICLEREERLIVLNDEANQGVVWAPQTREWRAISPDFAGLAWAEGRQISPDKAKMLFPKADFSIIPTLEKK